MLWGVLQFPGSCDERDALHACGLAGRARLIWHEERDLGGVDAVVIPGGFSYGDYLRAGAIARFSPAMESVAELAAAGSPVLGICNGFQVLCEAGLLPGALLLNDDLRFVCRQVELIAGDGGVEPSSGGAMDDRVSSQSDHRLAGQSPFLEGIEPGERLSIPVKHGEGRYWAPEEMLDEIEAKGQVAFRYAPGQNPNGSARDIAGVLSETGNVLGLMPHPEHAVDSLTGSTDGLRLFEGAARSLA
jgi:phosphoribosylformylglycinamidine synthase